MAANLMNRNLHGKSRWIGMVCILAVGGGLVFRQAAVDQLAPSSVAMHWAITRSVREAPLRFENREGESLEVSLRKCAVSGPDGTRRLINFDPPATMATLRDQLEELGALPVVFAPDGELRLVTRDLYVRFDGDGSSVLAGHPELTVRSRPDFAPGWLILQAPDPLTALKLLPTLRSTSGVATAVLALARQQILRTLPDDPLLPDQWHLKSSGSASPGTDVNVESVWNYGGSNGIRGSGMRIGIVDNGIEQTHPDLVANVDASNGWDWNGGDSNPSPGSGDRHGTACAGTAAARGNNTMGVSGVAPEATLVGLRLIAAPSTDEQEAQAMLWKKNLIQVKSCSWGPSDSGTNLEGPGPLTLAALQSAVTTGREGRGTVIVWAVGNGQSNGDNSNYDGYANAIQTIAAAAIDSSGNAANYSEAGANLIVCAPSSGSAGALGITTSDLTGSAGYNTASSLGGGDYTRDFGGTSASAPMVAGVAALMLEKNPQLGWRDVQEILIRSATQIRPSDSGWTFNGAGLHFHHRFGAGLVNASEAVALASGWQPLPSQKNISQSTAAPAAIPENSAAGVSISFPMASTNLRVEHVTLTADISHTSRGNLEVILTSPAGTVSRLAEVHNDTNDNFPTWTFSTVRNWGESADGEWILKIADRSSNGNSAGGNLVSATLKIFGSNIISENPPPSVAIVSPASGEVFGPGSTVAVSVSAGDLTAVGSAGEIVEIVLKNHGVPLDSRVSPPYDFQIELADGTHELVACATDSEGAASCSAPVVIHLENRPPAIDAVTLNAIGEAYADRDLRVLTVSAADPDGQAPVISYQWQSSTDGLTWQDAPGETSAILTASASAAGRLFRCKVGCSDGVLSGSPFVSQPVNLHVRPGNLVQSGQFYSYSSGLVLAGTPFTPVRQAILHEFSQGPSGGNSEWVEILLLKQTDLRYWDLSDTTNQLVFNNAIEWNAIPAGTLVVVYNGNTLKDPTLPADDMDPSDGRMVVSSTNPVFFATAFDTWIPLSNNGDSISLNNASSVRVHSLSYGSGTSPGLNLAAVGSGTAALFAGDTESAADDANSWQTTPAAGAVTPGAANGAVNGAFVSSLRSANPVIPARFRLAPASTLPAGLTLDTLTGKLSGTVTAAPGNYEIRLQRTNGIGGLVNQAFVLSVGAVGGYDAWIAGFPGLPDPLPDGDPEDDGIANLVEYAAGTSPVNKDSPLVFGSASYAISLQYRQSKLHSDVDLVPEWSPISGEGAVWDSAGIEIEDLGGNENFRTLRAKLAIDPSTPRRFLRLRASRVP